MTTLVFDCNFLCHVMRHTLNLKYVSESDADIYVLWKFMKHVTTVSNYFGASNWAFIWDGFGSKRKEFWADYKKSRSTRTKTKEELQLDKITFPQFNQIRDNLLPDLGFKNIYYQDGFEGDDLLASVTFNNRRKKMIVITGDKDMYQIINRHVSIYDSKSKKMTDLATFKKTYGILPPDWAKAKAIGGCYGDGVIGIKGVADPAKNPKTKAIAYLRGELTKGVVLARITSKESQKIIERNWKLVKLPFPGTDKIKLGQEQLNHVQVLRTLERYGLYDLVKHYNFKKIIESFNLY